MLFGHGGINLQPLLHAPERAAHGEYPRALIENSFNGSARFRQNAVGHARKGEHLRAEAERVRAAFGQRRKTLLNALTAQLPSVGKAEAEKALLSCGLNARVRGETLSIAQFAQLSDELFP